MQLIYADELGYIHSVESPGPEDLKRPGALVDPDLSAVTGVSPAYWRIEGGKVLPMSPEDREKRRLARKALHLKHNKSMRKPRVLSAGLPLWAKTLIAFAILEAVALPLLLYFLHRS